MEPVIAVSELVKNFTVSVQNPQRGVLRNFFYPDKKTITAVDHVSFSVHRGETIAFIGPNGAGKSTCIKILTGILYPTSGQISVLGLSPQEQRRELSAKIGAVFGQRSQLLFNLPAHDSFQLYGTMFGLSAKEIRARENDLIGRLDLADFIDQPVRKLSLGQRMRCEVAISLIHRPEIVFLDEPTIGLDVVAKQELRATLNELSHHEGTTVFLTSHDPGDIEALCRRTMIINHGRVILDTPTVDLQRNFLSHKEIHVTFKKEEKDPEVPGATLVNHSGLTAEYTVDTKEHSLNEVLARLLASFAVDDVDVSHASLEDIIVSIYQERRN